MKQAALAQPKRLNYFERYLSLWVIVCMVVGVLIGRGLPGTIDTLRTMEFGESSHINIPIAVLIWLMIIPMMMKVDFASIKNVGKRPRGLLVTLFVNWLVKPFSMALIAWVFFRHVFSSFISAGEADQYIAGAIILAAAPCTAMVFVWSYLTDGDPAYTLVQVSVNDLIMLFLFAPIVALSGQRRFLAGGALQGPPLCRGYFHRHPLVAGVLLRSYFIRRRGRDWFEKVLLPRFAPISMLALLTTLVLIFSFQADNITNKFLHVILIAIPILIQVYFNSSLALRTDEVVRRPILSGGPGRADRSEQFLRVGSRHCDRPVRAELRRSARNGGWGPDRSPGDAVRVLGLQQDS